MNKRITFAAVALLAAAGLAHAHGPQLQVTPDGNGKIITRNVFADEPYNTLLTSPTSAYVIPMTEGAALGGGLEYAARPYGSQGPGLAYGFGWGWDSGTNTPIMTFPAGSNFRIEFTDGLKRWNGSAFVDPGVEQLQMLRVSSNVIVASATTTDSGPFEGMNFGTITAPAAPPVPDAHGSARWRLLGSGGVSTAPTQDGVYLASLRLSSTGAGINPSDTYYFVLHKNAQYAEIAAAVNSAFPDGSVVQYVPEPAAGALAGLLMLAFGRRGHTAK